MTTHLSGSHTAVDTFARWYTAHEAGDVTGLTAVLAEDVTVHSLFRPEPARGRAAAAAHFRGTTTTFTDLTMALLSAAAADGNVVLAEVLFTGAFTGVLSWSGREHHGRGQRLAVPGAVVVHTRADAVTSVRTLFDRDDWLRQIGVLDADSPR
ncbi:nuclear transport factor 2 family protein [Nocardia jiangxiensis]|uniref:Nuclear transport factor 2 family protein n=1 Tax=Nocardia jiangxiensis TaxID=282685 RepID=A0ABW6RZ26_9NOCA